ncbi:hypothetical protein GCM10028806_33630 [Spirosoma terrae]|uniref:Uncharacterized protein n=1 Tax=Spirosoma terrae TaxID=1968276 RepID=A0A6L9L549_9BACT|nr:hypothetical protein [Spirosoma terrae]NDU95676.1 hypothetical protein [Spirosoma terrae]
MEIFKSASQLKLRFQTSRGVLTTEQLWDLTLIELDALAVALETEHEKSGKKSFLAKTSDKNKLAKLRFDVVLEVLTTRVAENQEAAEAAEIKAHNQKIIALIAEKEDETLKGKSVEELTAMLK